MISSPSIFKKQSFLCCNVIHIKEFTPLGYEDFLLLEAMIDRILDL